jgi:hypothetical protein
MTKTITFSEIGHWNEEYLDKKMRDYLAKNPPERTFSTTSLDKGVADWKLRYPEPGDKP